MLPTPVPCAKQSCPASRSGQHRQDSAWLCWEVRRTEAAGPVPMPYSLEGGTPDSSADAFEKKVLFLRENLKKYDVDMFEMCMFY